MFFLFNVFSLGEYEGCRGAVPRPFIFFYIVVILSHYCMKHCFSLHCCSLGEYEGCRGAVPRPFIFFILWYYHHTMYALV